MVFDEQRQEQIRGVFKLMAQYKEDASESNSAATEALNNLASSMSADKNEVKLIKKSLSKSFREYLEEQKGEPDTLEDAIQITSFVCRKA